METGIDIYEQLDPAIEGSFAYTYKKQKELLDWKTIRDNKDVSELENTYNAFKDLSDRIIVLSKEYFKKVLDNDTEHDNKRYYNLSGIYITEIQNLYLNPINYRLNQLNSEKSIKKANWSIAIGTASIVIAIIISLWSSIKPILCSSSPEKVNTETAENKENCNNVEINE